LASGSHGGADAAAELTPTATGATTANNDTTATPTSAFNDTPPPLIRTAYSPFSSIERLLFRSYINRLIRSVAIRYGRESRRLYMPKPPNTGTT
jgi:hypothetical protein